MNVNSDIFRVAFCQALNTEYSSESDLCVCVCVCVCVSVCVCVFGVNRGHLYGYTPTNQGHTSNWGHPQFLNALQRLFILHHYQVPHSRIVLL